jgi:hypothetical protein
LRRSSSPAAQRRFLGCGHGERLDRLFLGGAPVAVGLLEVGGVGEKRFRRLEADPAHGVAEKLAVLRLVDRLGGGADHLHAVFFQNAHLLERQGAIERGLSPHGGQECVGALLLDDFCDDLRSDRLHIGGVGQIRVGHDRGRIGIDQHDPVALFTEGLAGLGSRIVELAGLADDDRTGADDEDRGDVGTFGHPGSGSGFEGHQGSALNSGRHTIKRLRVRREALIEAVVRVDADVGPPACELHICVLARTSKFRRAARRPINPESAGREGR